MSSPTDGASVPEGTGAHARQFRLPALEVASAEFNAQQARALRGPSGCLVLLAGGAVLGAFYFFLEAGGRTLLMGGLAALLLGGIQARFGGGILAVWVAALGAGGAVAGAMSQFGIEAGWIYWIVALALVVMGFAIANSASGTWAGFFHARRQTRRSGCRIGFYRPFDASYSTQAKNLLLPLLRGYGTVFFVEDESFDAAEFGGLWSNDYKQLPGLAGGRKYTDEEWQSRVQAQLEHLDVAVVDISIPSPNVIWEIKQCYDQLPSHRIVLVASAAVFPSGVPEDVQDTEFQKALWAHIEPVLTGLKELGANPKTQPRFLLYPPEVEGQLWLANALFQAMANIVAVETGSIPSIP